MGALRASAALGGIVALALVAGSVGTASGQVGAPVLLGPSNAPPSADDSPASGSPEGRRPLEVEQPLGGVRVEGLDAIDIDAVGTLGDALGGLGVDMWAGTPRALVERLLPQLPVATRSRAARNLMQRLLLTTATPPAGDRGATSLLSQRVDSLAAMGDLAGVDSLLLTAPRRLADADLARAGVNNRLLLYDFAGACSDVDGTVAGYTTVFWQKALILCQTLAQDYAQASLGLGLLRESGGASDHTFFTVVESLTAGAGLNIDAPGAATALNLALLRAAGGQVPQWLVEAATPAMLRTIALSPNADLGSRLDAARRAEAIGALNSEALASLYVGIGFDAGAIAGAFDAGTAPQATLALQYLAALDQTVPAARAEALRQSWRLAQDRGGYPTAARLGLPLALELTPSAELAWFTGDAVRVLLLGGRIGAALAWYQVAQREAVFDADVARIEASLWPLIAMAADPDVLARDLLLTTAQAAEMGRLLAWDDTRFARWQAAAPAQVAGQAGLVLSLLDGLGVVDSGSRWAAVVQNGPAAGRVDGPAAGGALPSAALLFALDDAAAGGRRGEAILLALIAVGEDLPGTTHPLVLNRVLTALRQVGLDADARALAVEAALTAGL